ncbi:MAG: hypothetical protein AABY16_00965, partial [Nanoarchaeota archaeon]
MNKSVVLFWSLFAGVLIFALGVQFAYSQSGGFATTTPPPSTAWHPASSVVCDNCITSGNIADNAVGSAEIATGAIFDGDVSNTAGIFTRKISGANGWHFLTGALPNNLATFTPLSTIGNMGMTTWAGSYVEVICDPAV